MKLSDFKDPVQLWKRINYNILRPVLWNRFNAKQLGNLSNKKFTQCCGFNDTPAEFLAQFRKQSHGQFFFHPGNRKEFFLNVLMSTQSYDSICEEADDVLGNIFQTLGSEKLNLGKTIQWQKDFKNGKEWPLLPVSELDLLDLKNPSDVKVPWELSRFHQVWWLGKAYWVSGNEQYAQKFQSLIEDWIECNPVGRGVNWTVAMEASIRSANWIAGYYFFCDSKSIPAEFWTKFLKSLYVHGLFIENNLEYARINGNHFLSDVAGLLFLGTFFRQTSFGKRWLVWSVQNLETEMMSQVLPDGVDFEKSTSYHRLVLELFYSSAILCKMNRIELSPQYWKRLEKMFEFVLHYTRADGTIPLIGDADDGRLFRLSMSEDVNDHRHALAIGAVLFQRNDLKLAAGKFYQDVLWMFGAEGFEKWQMLKEAPRQLTSQAFPEGGFYIMRSKNAHMFIDAGELGQRGRGGHGHNDTLSFELWISGKSFIVDPGTYAYTFDTQARQEFRSTSAHNTAMIDGCELAEFANLWSVKSDTTNPKVLEWTPSDKEDILIAEHYAYQRLTRPVTHRRRFHFQKDDHWFTIEDWFLGNGGNQVELFFHLHPDVSMESVDTNQYLLRNGDVEVRLESSEGCEVRDAFYSRSYGVKVPSKCIRMKFLSQHDHCVRSIFEFSKR